MISEAQYEKAKKIIKQYEEEQAELHRIKNEKCKLGRFPQNCSKHLYTSGSCNNCGHSINEVK